MIHSSSEHFNLYRDENAFGETLTLQPGAYTRVLLLQPYNAWCGKHWEGTQRLENENHLLRMLETAYQQGRESMRRDITRLLEPPVGKR